MKKKNLLIWILGIASSGFCLAAGLYLVFQSSHSSDKVSFALGLYFIGKAFFVGPLLIVTASK